MLSQFFEHTKDCIFSIISSLDIVYMDRKYCAKEKKFVSCCNNEYNKYICGMDDGCFYIKWRVQDY